MTPDDERDGARIDGLLASYGTLTADVGRLQERASAHDREFRAVREQRVEDIASVMRVLERVDQSCNNKAESVKHELHQDIAAVKKAVADAADAAERKRERNEWTLTQKLALFSATFSPFVGALIVVLTK